MFFSAALGVFDALHIDRMRYRLQVIGVYATMNIATMVYFQITRDWTFGGFIREPMRKLAAPEHSVTRPHERSSP